MALLPNLLIVDDDVSFLKATALSLQDQFQVHCVEDPRDAAQYLDTTDVVVSDFRMTPLSGHDIITLARSRPRPVPVILVSAYASKEVAIMAANLRVFAILEKPVSLAELCHYLTSATSGWKPSSQIVVNKVKLTASVGDCETSLTLTEFKILELFLACPNQPIHREELIKSVWGPIKQADNVLDTHISNLKRKLNPFSERFKLIRGRGYVYAE